LNCSWPPKKTGGGRPFLFLLLSFGPKSRLDRSAKAATRCPREKKKTEGGGFRTTPAPGGGAWGGGGAEGGAPWPGQKGSKTRARICHPRGGAAGKRPGTKHLDGAATAPGACQKQPQTARDRNLGRFAFGPPGPPALPKGIAGQGFAEAFLREKKKKPVLKKKSLVHSRIRHGKKKTLRGGGKKFRGLTNPLVGKKKLFRRQIFFGGRKKRRGKKKPRGGARRGPCAHPNQPLKYRRGAFGLVGPHQPPRAFGGKKKTTVFSRQRGGLLGRKLGPQLVGAGPAFFRGGGPRPHRENWSCWGPLAGRC